VDWQPIAFCYTSISLYLIKKHEEEMAKKRAPAPKQKCRFCTPQGCPRPAFVDYKDISGLKKLCTAQGRMYGRKRSGICATFQRSVSQAIKRARTMALLPYVGE
jgi:small subunit ribosomal protein S18